METQRVLANVLQKADSHISALERQLVEKREQEEGMPFIRCTYHGTQSSIYSGGRLWNA